MELIELKDLKPGMIMAKPIYDSRNVTLVPAGVELTDKKIEKLNYGASNFEQFYYVETSGAESVIIEDKISENLRKETAEFIRNKQIDKLMEQAKRIRDNVIDYNISNVDYYDTRNKEEYVSRHSVNVAIVACIIGRSMELSYEELYELTLAGLLHDFARISKVDEQIYKYYESKLVCPREKLTPILSYAYLKETDYFKFNIIPTTVLMSILYHHENENGTGYYMKDSKTIKKYKYASILHVADVYDSLINKDKDSLKIDLPIKQQYFFERDGINPRTIINFFMSDCSADDEQRLFDKKVIKNFLKYISLYTKGKRVLLSNGDEAIVNRNIENYIERPEVVVVSGELKGETIDLSTDKDHFNLIVEDYAKKM